MATMALVVQREFELAVGKTAHLLNIARPLTKLYTVGACRYSAAQWRARLAIRCALCKVLHSDGPKSQT